MRRTSPPWTYSLLLPFGFDLLYVLVIIRLERRNLVWINAIPHPTAEWIPRQVTGLSSVDLITIIAEI